MPAVHQLRNDFGIEQLVMVGDRGMISNKAIDELRETDGVGWITALKSASIRALVDQGRRDGADCVILGCTEIGLLIGPDDVCLPAFDSTILHADAALDLSLAGRALAA